MYNLSLSPISYDIIAITETWLDNEIEESTIIIPNYIIFRCDRDLTATSKARGGGILLVVKNLISHVLIYHLYTPLLNKFKIHKNGRKNG